MEIKEIESRIEKKEAAIEKAKKLVGKYTANFDTEDIEIIANSVHNYKNYREVVIPTLTAKYDRDWGYGVKGRDAEAAINNMKKVEEAELQLEKYKNILKAAQVKQGKLDAPRIKIIMDFLDDWKQRMTDYTVRNMKVYKEYFKADHNSCDWWNHRGWITSTDNPEAISTKEWKAEYNRLRDHEKELLRQVSPLTKSVYYRASEDGINHEELDKILTKEADDMYLDMIERVTDITGEITDATNLGVGAKGELNGIIYGTKGAAKIQTIGAGGYNIQRYHFRTLVNPTNYRRPETVGGNN